MALLSAGGVAPTDAPGFFQPLRHGVVFWQEKTPEDAIRELERVKADGFGLIKLASWVWTPPRPGSDLEAVSETVLDWCDANEVGFFLLHNIQYGSPGEGGDLDAAWKDPMAAAPLLEDWVRVLQGHQCVAGVILGNEVRPIAGNRTDTPQWWAGFTDAMRQRYGGIAALNEVWGTGFGSWDELDTAPEGSPGQTDLERFATDAYARFYGTLFDEVLRPALGELEYGTKTGGDPILHRRLARFSLITWDDVLANYPQWRIKALCDIGRALDKPVFNSELHLYHDTYAYNQSVAMSRYRYFTSALNGETTTASFAWGQWGAKPETAAIHARTPAILAELKGLERVLRAFAAAEPELHVLLTPELARGDDTDPERKPPAEAAYADAAALGRPWRFVCEEDIATVTSGTLLVSAPTGLTMEAARQAAALPDGVRVVAVDSAPARDDYGRPLPAELAEALTRRVQAVAAVSELATAGSDPGEPYNRLGSTNYLWWSAERGHFGGPMTYPLLEARRVRDGDSWLVSVVNHATGGAAVSARLPWAGDLDPGGIQELTANRAEVRPDDTLSFPPLAVRIFRCE